MIIGETVFGSGTYLSDWFPRRGDAAIFTAEALQATGTLFVGIQTKNTEDVDASPSGSGSGTLGVSNAIQVSAGLPKLGTISVAAMKELVRYFYLVTGSSNWVHFRVLPPVWKQN